MTNYPSLLRRQYLLNADLVNQMLSAQVGQMRSFPVIRQVCTNPVGHHHNESAIIHIQPVGSATGFIVAVSYEWLSMFSLRSG